METSTIPHFDATFPSFVRKASRPKREQPRPAKRAPKKNARGETARPTGEAFFRKAFLLSK